MYSKLFARITESSLMEEPINVRYTFVMLIAISDPEGYVIGTDVAICRRLNMPLAEFQQCAQALMQPDPSSNSKEQEGRRIIESDGERGYKVVNYLTYRDMKDEHERREYMREYMRNYRGKKAKLTPVNKRKLKLAQLTHAEADAEADEKGENKPPTFPERFTAKWNSLPSQFPKIRNMPADRITALRARYRDEFWLENWEKAIELLPSCSFAAGKNDRGWVLDVDCFLKPGTVTKILEGKYSNGSSPNGSHAPKATAMPTIDEKINGSR